MSSESMRKIKGYGVGERAVIGKLKRLGGVRSYGDIMLYERDLNVEDVFEFSDDISGVVAVGEPSDSVSVALRAVGISAVFISHEDAQHLCGGERAVMYPDRNTLFIAPKIEIVEDFYTRLLKEADSDLKENRGVDCRELYSGKVGMRLLTAYTDPLGEEAAFEIYKSVAEECELKKLVLIFDAPQFGDIEQLRAAIKGGIRAAVYTKLIFAVSVNSFFEYERVLQLIKWASKELKDAGSEIPDTISIGVVIKDAKEVVCIEEYSRAAELVLIDSIALVGEVGEDDRERVFDGYLRVIEERMSGSVKDIVFVGEKRLIEKCAHGISMGHTYSERACFFADVKNIK